MEQILKIITGFLSVISLFLLYFVSQTDYSVFSNCDGKVKISGVLIKTFVSSKGNYIGVLNNSVLVYLNDYPVFSGEKVTIFGKAQRFQNVCWIFPDKVIVND